MVPIHFLYKREKKIKIYIAAIDLFGNIHDKLPIRR